MADGISVKVIGARETAAALGHLPAETDKRLSAALLAVATPIGAQIAAAFPHDSGDAAATVVAHARIRGASISIGTGDHDDYVPWLDFGGSVGRGHRQSASGKGIGGGSVYRQVIKGGRYLYPIIQKNRAKAIEGIDKAIAAAAKELGLVTSGGQR